MRGRGHAVCHVGPSVTRVRLLCHGGSQTTCWARRAELGSRLWWREAPAWPVSNRRVFVSLPGDRCRPAEASGSRRPAAPPRAPPPRGAAARRRPSPRARPPPAAAPSSAGAPPGSASSPPGASASPRPRERRRRPAGRRQPRAQLRYLRRRAASRPPDPPPRRAPGAALADPPSPTARLTRSWARSPREHLCLRAAGRTAGPALHGT